MYFGADEERMTTRDPLGLGLAVSMEITRRAYFEKLNGGQMFVNTSTGF
jgi:hypothetical protein